MAVKNAGLGGVKLIAFDPRVERGGQATAHIHDAAGIPGFNELAGGRFIKRRGQAGWIVLLDDIGFQSGAVGINVTNGVTVAMADPVIGIELRAVIVETVAEIEIFIPAVVVGIGDADLMTAGFMREGVEVSCPAQGDRAVAVIPAGGHLVEAAVAVAVFRPPHDGRMHAVTVKNAHVAVHLAGRRVGIRNGGARFFHAGQAIQNGKILDGVIRSADHGAVRKNNPLGGAHNHLGLAIAIQVKDGGVVALTDADGGGTRRDIVMIGAVVAQVHPPQESTVTFVGFEKLAGVARRLAVNHEIIFTVAVQIADPAELDAQRPVRRVLDGHTDIRVSPRRRIGRQCGGVEH